MILLLFVVQQSLVPESLMRRHGEEWNQPHTPQWQKKSDNFNYVFNACHFAQDTNTQARNSDWPGIEHMPVLVQGSMTVPPKLHETSGQFQRKAIPQEGISDRAASEWA